jgi:hypothetical protein
MAENEKFDVTLEVNISVREAGKQDLPWYKTNASVEYKAMNYLQVCATNQAVVSFSQILADLGWDGAVLKKFPKDLVAGAKKVASGK